MYSAKGNMNSALTLATTALILAKELYSNISGLSFRLNILLIISKFTSQLAD